jgi:hypothetical protein
MKMPRTVALAALFGSCGVVMNAEAQPIGTYRWQLQPYCNVVTIAVVQQGGQYQLDGKDDLCGSSQSASLVGIAMPNPNGSIGLGMTLVTGSGNAVHVYAAISIGTLGGMWRDSAGNSGVFTFLTGDRVPGNPRPIPPAGSIPPASITGVQIAPGTIGVTQVNIEQVQARVSGGCGVGAISAVRAEGAVICAPGDAGPFKRGLFDEVNVPESAANFGTAAVLATLTFTAPVTGWAVATGTGYCEGNSLTTGSTSTVLFIGAPSDLFSRFYIAVQKLQQASSIQTHQWPWAIQRDIPIVAGNEYTMVVKAYHGEGPSAATRCTGNVTIRAQAGYFP